MGGPIEQAYLVSVEALEEICKNLSHGEVKYSIITACDPKEVVFSYTDSPDDLDSIYYSFPIVADIWPLGIRARNEAAGLMACLHVYTGRKIRNRIYLYEGELKQDGIGDWEKIWGRLEAALIKGRNVKARKYVDPYPMSRKTRSA